MTTLLSIYHQLVVPQSIRTTNGIPGNIFVQTKNEALFNLEKISPKNLPLWAWSTDGNEVNGVGTTKILKVEGKPFMVSFYFKNILRITFHIEYECNE